MLNIASEEIYQDGQTIIEEGTKGDWVYVILSGTVEISKTVEGKKCVIELLQPDEVFGELAFLGGITRTATARAIGETTVGVVDRAFLDREFNKLPSDFRAILVAVVQRFKKLIDQSSSFSSRKEIRVLQTLSLTYKDKKAFANAYTGNMNSGGLFIGTENPLEKGEHFLLKLQLPGLPDPMRIKCGVALSRKKVETTDDSPAGMGITFIEMTKKDNQMLRLYLKDMAKGEQKS
jgi:CRP/FNR family cyclic AMP-dependent transcriptional regulator